MYPQSFPAFAAFPALAHVAAFCIALTGGIAPTGASAAHAQSDAVPLSLAEVERLAVRNQPLLEAFERRADAAREAAVAERQLPDPRLRAGLINLPVTTGDAFQIARDDQTMAAVGITQDVVRIDKREAAGRRFEAEADAALAERDADVRRIRRDAALAWVDAQAAAQRRELFDRMQDELVAERDVTRARLAAGGADARDVFAIDVALAGVEDDRERLRRDERRARALLARWIGAAAAERPLAAASADTVVATRDLAERVQRGETVTAHPYLEEARAIETVARRDVARAQLDTQRDWSWEVMYGKRFAGRSDMLTVQVSVPLLWDAPNRQDRRTAEKLALAERAGLLAQDRARQLAADAQAAVVDWEGAVAREAVHTRLLLPAAAARLETTLAAYRAGKIAYSAVAEARRAVIDARAQHVAIAAEVDKASVALRYFE
ncbi:MAG: TolC family protein [Casimicrobiaceae bacterium]